MNAKGLDVVAMAIAAIYPCLPNAEFFGAAVCWIGSAWLVLLSEELM